MTPALPHNEAAEASILGGVILRNEVLADLAELETDDFFDHRHKVTWEAIRNLEAAKKPIDVVTLEGEVEKQGKLDAVGGIAFFGELALRVPTADNVVAYASDVRLLARNRRAILALTDALGRAQNWPHDPNELIAEVAAQLARIGDDATPRRDDVEILDVPTALERMRALAESPVYETPFPTLNQAIGFGGLIGTQVYTVAAGTGRGKTTWVTEVAQHVAVGGTPVLIATYEMEAGYFVARKAAGLIGAYANDVIRGRVDYSLVLRAMPLAHLFFVERLPPAKLRIAVDKVAQKHGTAPLLIVDYIQKLAAQIARAMPRPDMRAATTEASEGLADLARRTRAAVLAVSSVGRGKGKLTGDPRKHAPYELVEIAKESGDIEFDGAGVIALSLSDEMDGDERVGTITLAKARFGRELHIDARYDGRRGTWREVGEAFSERRTGTQRTNDEPSDATASRARDEILAALKRGPQPTKTAIGKMCGSRKATVMAEIQRLIDERILDYAEGAYRIREIGQQRFPEDNP